MTLKIQEPNNTTELTLLNAQGNGGGGLVITDQGGGNYRASFSYNPNDAQTLGLYDLYGEVFDGEDSFADGYANNLDELEINEILPNNAPVIVAAIESAFEEELRDPTHERFSASFRYRWRLHEL